MIEDITCATSDESEIIAEQERVQLNKKISSSVLMSKRANLYYLEHAKVYLWEDRVVYLTDTHQNVEQIFNIPDKNTACILMGTGSSITSAAVRKLAESNVMLGFSGSGGSPVFGALDYAFMPPLDEYGPTQYGRQWILNWFNEDLRLNTARDFLRIRIKRTNTVWNSLGLVLPESLASNFELGISKAKDTTQLLSAEAQWAKNLYACLAREHRIPFKREEGKRSKANPIDRVNGLLDHGNYIAYGYASVVLHTLGIPYIFPLLHGKTRRGALVFDVET
jgi:CRISPR-associated protein Cas1